MKVDIEISMEGAVDERLPYLTAPESPLRLEDKLDEFFRMRSKDRALDSKFIYGSPDPDFMSEEPMHEQVQRELGFTPGATLHYGRCNMTPRKAVAFRKILDYLDKGNIPYYMTATDMSSEELLLMGSNPRTNIKIVNQRFEKSLPGLLG